jgi:hypothetical protein
MWNIEICVQDIGYYSVPFYLLDITTQVVRKVGGQLKSSGFVACYVLRSHLIVSCSCRWFETTSLNWSHRRAYCSFPRWGVTMVSHGGMILTGRPRNLEKNLSQCHIADHRSHMYWPGSEPGPPLREAGDLSHGTASVNLSYKYLPSSLLTNALFLYSYPRPSHVLQTFRINL